MLLVDYKVSTYDGKVVVKMLLLTGLITAGLRKHDGTESLELFFRSGLSLMHALNYNFIFFVARS